ncbi:hypothetical protein [Pseudoduganella sp. HUAS MS19]
MYEPLSKALVEAGLPPHTEPDSEGAEEFFSCQMWGYSGVHYLRRIAAYVGLGKEVPGPGGDNPASDPVLEEYYDHLAPGFEHLVMHSDAEGFYVPLDFEDVIYPSEELGVAGGIVGSSVRLLSECKRLAAWLELPLDLDPESEEVWDAANSPETHGPKWKRYGKESFACIRLIRAAEASIDSGAAIVFC